MATKKTYENTRTGAQEKLDPNDPATQERVRTGELVEAQDTGQGEAR